MFTDFRKKTLLANWLPWQQGNVYFWFIKLKILLIPSFEKLPSFKVLACSVVEFWAIYWAWGGKHPPPPVLIGLRLQLLNPLTTLSDSSIINNLFSTIKRFKNLLISANSMRGKPVTSGERAIILNVFKHLKGNFPLESQGSINNRENI